MAFVGDAASHATTMDSPSKSEEEHMQTLDFATYSSKLAEYEHFQRTVNAFKSYSNAKTFILNSIFAGRRINLAYEQFGKLSDRHRRYVSSDFSQHLADIRDAVYQNQQLVDQMVAQANNIFGEHAPWSDIVATDRAKLPKSSISEAGDETDPKLPAQRQDDRNILPSADGSTEHRSSPSASSTRPASYHFEKVQTTLRQIARDWSISGAEERKKCYKPIIDAVEEFLPHEIKPQADNGSSSLSPRILVPGAGLCRLAWEFAHRGYAACANEFSMYMLVGSYFVLNCCPEINQHSLQPWATCFSNNKTRHDQLATISFPDVCPHQLPEGAQFSMSAGDFTRVFTADKNHFDAVTTCFFIDTAHNVLEYLETIWAVLRPGGYWINLGPLLYHFDDVPGEQSLELPYEDLRQAIINVGFQYVVSLEKTKTRLWK